MSLKYLKITLKTNHIPAEFFSLHFFSALVQLLWLAAVTVDSHNIHQFNVLFQNCTKPLFSQFYHFILFQNPLTNKWNIQRNFRAVTTSVMLHAGPPLGDTNGPSLNYGTGEIRAQGSHLRRSRPRPREDAQQLWLHALLKGCWKEISHTH